VIKDVPHLVNLAALNQSPGSEHGPDRLADSLAAIDHEQASTFDHETPPDQALKEAPAHPFTLGAPFDESENVFLSRGVDPQRDDEHVIAEAGPVEHDHRKIQVTEGARDELVDLLLRLRDEPPRDTRSADADRVELLVEGFKTSGVTPGTDSDENLVERVIPKGVLLADRLPRRQFNLLAGHTPNSWPGESNLPPPENHDSFIGAVPKGSAIGLGLMLRPAQFCSIFLE
jgi:hypothetical protein